MVVFFLIAWIGLCMLVGAFAASKGRSFGGFFVLSILISPLLGFIVALLARNTDQLIRAGHAVEGSKKCPFCAEIVRAEAIKCKHCGSDLPAVEAISPEHHVVTTDEEYRRAFNIQE